MFKVIRKVFREYIIFFQLNSSNTLEIVKGKKLKLSAHPLCQILSETHKLILLNYFPDE